MKQRTESDAGGQRRKKHPDEKEKEKRLRKNEEG